MRCLIVDDEPAAREILESFVDDTPGLSLAGMCTDAMDAREWLEENEADLLFVDINMPRLSGLSFIKTLKDSPLIILTTAYSEHALDGFDLGVVDYLLKPFSFERFLQAVDKSREHYRQKQGARAVTVKADGKLYRIAPDDILFVEAQGDYLTLHTRDQKITFYSTLTGFLKHASLTSLIRVHRSWLVNLDAITYVEGNMIRIGEARVPIGNSYKEAFMQHYQ